jgi:hypothetical protein
VVVFPVVRAMPWQRPAAAYVGRTAGLVTAPLFGAGEAGYSSLNDAAGENQRYTPDTSPPV